MDDTKSFNFFITRYLFYAFLGADQSCFHVMLQLNWKRVQNKIYKKLAVAIAPREGPRIQLSWMLLDASARFSPSPLVHPNRDQSFRPLLSPCCVCRSSPWSNASMDGNRSDSHNTFYHFFTRIRLRTRLFSNTNTKRMSRIRIHIWIFTPFEVQHLPKIFIDNLQLQ
jgi:hypothetical protein